MNIRLAERAVQALALAGLWLAFLVARASAGLPAQWLPAHAVPVATTAWIAWNAGVSALVLPVVGTVAIVGTWFARSAHANWVGVQS